MITQKPKGRYGFNYGHRKEDLKYLVNEVYPISDEDKVHTNSFTDSYLQYIEEINPEWINGITYTRLVRLNLLRSDGKTSTAVDTAAVNLSAYPKNPQDNYANYLETAYDLLAGSYPGDMHDLILVTDKYNRVNKRTGRAGSQFPEKALV